MLHLTAFGIFSSSQAQVSLVSSKLSKLKLQDKECKRRAGECACVKYELTTNKVQGA